MLRLILLLTLLVAMSGFIAYAGDVLGTMVGKRRLSLFGWRPRRTGQVVGVGVGIVIMFSTLGVFSLTSRGAIQAIINFQSIEQERQRLQAETLILQQQLDTLNSETSRLEELNQLLEDDNFNYIQVNQDLRDARDQLNTQTVNLQAEITALQQERLDLQTQASDLALLTRQLREQSQAQAIELNELLAQQETFQSCQELAFCVNAIIHSGIIEARDDLGIYEALFAFEEAANNQVLSRGGSFIQFENEKRDIIFNEIRSTPGPDFLVFYSAGNYQQGERVSVRASSTENRLLISQGQLVSTLPLHLGTRERPVSQEEIRGAIARLRARSSDRLLRLNIFEAITPEFTLIDEEQFSNQLLRLTGPVTIATLAHEDIYHSGPAILELKILN